MTACDTRPFVKEPSQAEALRNVAICVMEHTQITRYRYGRGRRPTYAADAVAIRDSARQLAEMVLEIMR